MSTLYEISTEAERISDLMERTQGNEALMTMEDREYLTTLAECLRTEADAKADGYARMLRELDARAEARMAESRRLAEMAATDRRHAENVRRFLMGCMERLGMNRMEGPTFTLALQWNGGVQPIDVFVEADRLPDRFARISRSPDKEALRTALLSGDAEAKQYACLMERTKSLRIK